MWEFASRRAAIWAIAVAIGVGATAAVVGVSGPRNKTAALLNPDDAEVVARGETVYVAHCASCHGRNLEGQPDWRTKDQDGFLPAPPHDESGHTWHHPDRLLFDITKLGVAVAANLKDYKTRMPVFGGTLSDKDIVAVLSYIKSRWPEDVRRRHDQLNRVMEERRSAAR
jgi:S-disulfanyl-L-cysteine oxidoreductase SoxD